MNRSIALGVCVMGLAVATVASFDARGQVNPAVMPASGPMSKQTMSRLLLTDAARVGNRVVAVGDRGYIVYSDNNGESWQRAKTPPNTPLLTAVFFLDAAVGWAVGHDSKILTSTESVAKPQPPFASVVEIQHGRHGIDPQSIDVELLDPVQRVRQQEIADFVARVVEEVRPPLGVIAQSRILVFIAGGAVKAT